MMVLNWSDLDPKPAKLVYFLFCITLYKAEISYNNTIKQYQHSEISPLTKPGYWLDTEVTLKFNLSLGLKHYHSSYRKLVHKVV